MSELEGKFTVPKGLLAADCFREERACRRGAFLDLWRLANDRPRTVIIKGKKVALKRGQLAYSQATLGEIWRWDRDKVHSVLVEWQNEGYITFDATNSTTIITVVDYTIYNPDSTPKTPPDTEAEVAPEVAPEPAAEPAQKVEGGSKKMGRGEGDAPPATGFQEVPPDEVVAGFCAGYRNLAKGITEGIPEGWWKDWMANAITTGRWPVNWQRVIVLKFEADFVNHHPKAVGTGQKKNGAGVAEDIQRERRRRELLEERGQLREWLSAVQHLPADAPDIQEKMARLEAVMGELGGGE